jgi:hypothetical protein
VPDRRLSASHETCRHRYPLRRRFATPQRITADGQTAISAQASVSASADRSERAPTAANTDRARTSYAQTTARPRPEQPRRPSRSPRPYFFAVYLPLLHTPAVKAVPFTFLPLSVKVPVTFMWIVFERLELRAGPEYTKAPFFTLGADPVAATVIAPRRHATVRSSTRP